MQIIHLKTENMVNPLGIDKKRPYFSWEIKGQETYQKKYRILVASSEELLFKGESDMWDSGMVYSSKTLFIRYMGKALSSCSVYYWKVFSNDIESEIQKFETAFLNADKEFIADWIGQPLGFSGSADDVRFDFEINKPVKRARFYVCALGAGRFFLNGKPLGNPYFDGSVAVYEKHLYYRTYELDFRMGKNALCGQIGYGFYGAKKMYGVMRTEFEDGTISITPTMPGRVWNVKRSAIRQNGIYDGETYDARYEENWKDPEYKVSFGNWVATFLADSPKGKFFSNPIEPMKIVERFAPKEIKERKNGLFVNTGVNICGFLTIKVKGEAGSSIKIHHAERLFSDGSLDNANYRAAECVDCYILKGNGEEEYTPSFTYHGFQYALIDIEGNAKVIEVIVNHLRTDVETAGNFFCDDEKLNYLHKIAFRTESNNLNGVFTDCPQRDERLGWLNDLTSRIYESICNFSLVKFLSNFIDMITLTADKRGVIKDTAPYTVGSEVADPVSAYTLLGTFAYQFYHDKEVLKRNYKGFCKWIHFLQEDADKNDGTMAFGIYGDWCPAKIFAKPENGYTFSQFVSPSFMSAAYFLWYLKQMKSIASILGKNKDADDYEGLFDKYRKAFDKKYYNDKTQIYGNGSQTECAVMMTILSSEHSLCMRLAAMANQDVIAHGYHTTCGNQGYRHLLYNLSEYGYTDTVLALLRNEEYPGWGFMVKEGATSVWERWENAVGSDMHSFNHPMFAAYDGVFYNYLAGIRMEKCKDAFKTIEIEPVFAKGINHVSASYETLRGTICSEWFRKDNKITLKVVAPGNTDLIVRTKGKIIQWKGKSYVEEITLSNGEYEFTVE